MSSASWDEYVLVQEALLASEARVGGEHSLAAPRLIVVAFVDKWSKPGMVTAEGIEAIRMGRDVEGFAQVFVIEANTEQDRCWELGVVSTPALLFFWDAQQVTVQRPDWGDDVKFVGAHSQDVLLEVIRHARECCASAEDGKYVVSLDF